MIDLSKYPDKPGVYLMKGKEEDMLYIGKANNLRVRLRQYFAEKGGDQREMIPFLREEIASIDTIVVLNEKDALILENNLIKKHKPKYNVLLKDDKNFIRLILTRHEYPALRIVRDKKKPKEAKYTFGPYTNAKAARQIFDLLQRLFPLRQCSDGEFENRTRPCLLYDIKKCVAPCVNLCTKDEYESLVESVKKLLQGSDKEVMKDLKQKMKEAAESLQFERAANLRDLLHSLEHMLTVQHVDNPEAKDCDVLGMHREADTVMLVKLLFREGKLIASEHFSFHQILSEDSEVFESFLLQHYPLQNLLPKEILLPLNLPNLPILEELIKVTLHAPIKGKKKELIAMAEQNALALFQRETDARSLKEKMLVDLQETLMLTRFPRHIDCFDTSHLAGENPVASKVSFINGEKEKNLQRYFHIRTVTKGDDYGAMREVLMRHLSKAKETNSFPDLLIVDGGKGHLNVALEVFAELNIATIDLIGLAKQDSLHTKGLTQERIFLPNQKEAISIPSKSPLLFLLQKIRDEAHRVAIQFQKKKRTKELIKTALDEIKGIGPIKRKRLLLHFGSVKALSEASDDEILKVQGITSKDLKRIREFFKKKE